MYLNEMKNHKMYQNVVVNPSSLNKQWDKLSNHNSFEKIALINTHYSTHCTYVYCIYNDEL